MHFLSTWLIGIIAITDRAHLTWICLWLFTSAKPFPLSVNSTLQFSIVFSINFMTSLDIFFETVYNLALRNHSVWLFMVIPRHPSRFALLEDVLNNVHVKIRSESNILSKIRSWDQNPCKNPILGIISMQKIGSLQFILIITSRVASRSCEGVGYMYVYIYIYIYI